MLCVQFSIERGSILNKNTYTCVCVRLRERVYAHGCICVIYEIED